MRLLIFKRRNVLVLSGVLLLLLSTPALATRVIHRGPDDKPADPTFSPSRLAFDCQPPDSLTLVVSTTVTLSDSTIGRTSLINGYTCAPWSENGPELIYRLNVASDLALTAILRGTDPAVDLDIFLLNDCNSDSCLVGANTEFGIELTAGIYYFIVDGVSAASVFDVELTTRPLGVPDVICAQGGAFPVTCASETITITGESLFDQPDLIRQYDCGTSPKTSGEIWYSVTLPGTHEVTINVRDVAPNLDVNFWLFAGCGPNAECLQFVDQNLGSEGETLTWNNISELPVTAFLGVDAVRPPSQTAAGTYTIDFQCQSNVATVPISFGGLKALYR